MTDSNSSDAERIAKVIARSGVASRRDAEKMIVDGRVSVNGKIITSPALDVSLSDKVTIDGKPIDAPQETRLWLYYKPLGLVTTEKDDQGRRTIFDEMPAEMPRVLNVGRLDLNSEGLLLLTTDGGLKRRLEHPDTAWLRKYRVRVNGRPTTETFNPLRDGITIDGEDFQPMEVTLDRQQGANAWLTLGIREGKNREIRRAMTAVGMTVNRLIRVSYGPFRLNEMQPGDVVEVKRKVLREQLGDKLLTGAEDGRAPRSEHVERSQRRSSRPERPGSERAGMEQRSARPARSDDDGPKKGFGRQRDFAQGSDQDTRGERKPWAKDGKPRSEGFRPAREDGDRPRKPYGDKSFAGPRPAREDGERRGFAPREGDDRKPWVKDGKPRSEGFRPAREDGDRPRKPYGDKSFSGPRPAREDGERRGFAPREGDDRKPRWSKDSKPRAEGFRSHRDDNERPPRKSFGDKSFAGPRPAREDGEHRGFAPRDGDDRKKPFVKRPSDRDGESRPPRRFNDDDRKGGYAPKPQGKRPYGGQDGASRPPRFDSKPGGSDRAPRAEGEGRSYADRKPGGFKSQGFKSHGGSGKPRTEGFKSHRSGSDDAARPAKPRFDGPKGDSRPTEGRKPSGAKFGGNKFGGNKSDGPRGPKRG